MESFKDFISKSSKKKCSDVESIEDINNQFDYIDERPNGPGDNPKVACGQDNGYNELEYIFTEYLEPFIEAGEITNQQALDALCYACHELPNPRDRKDFYQYLSDLLDIPIG